MKHLTIYIITVLISVCAYANSGPDSSIDVYTKPGCSACTKAVNFLKKNWGPAGWDTVPKATLVYPISNKDNKKQLESLFHDSTDVNIKDIKFPVIIMRNAGEPFKVYYDIDNVENLLKCQLKRSDCKETSYKSGYIRSGNYGEVLTLDDKSSNSTIKTVVNEDGSTYTGQMKNNKMHGQGTLKYSNGSIYTGMMKDGKMNGQGILTFPNGDKYEGRWKNNLMDGYGTYNWSDGSWYQGNYKDGKFHGEGILTTTGESGKQQNGKFKNGQLTGN